MDTMITITFMKIKIQSNEEQEVPRSLVKLQDLCIKRKPHKEWVIMDDYKSILIGLLGAKNSEIRQQALDIFCILAEENDDSREGIAKLDDAIEFTVPSLARKPIKRMLAAQLLLELPRNNIVWNFIGTVQGCSVTS
ncbi:hypothetical protein U1Q18_043898 [Sarracenia purpurea var. burkii]